MDWKRIEILTKKETENVLSATDTLIRRIETTKKTDPEVFAEVGKYVKASYDLLDPKRNNNSNDKRYVLAVQLLALELAKIAPAMIDKIMAEVSKE